MRRLCLPLLTSAALSLACAADKEEAAGGATGNATGSAEGTDSATGNDSASGSDTAAPAINVPARNIQITAVEANPGVAIKIVDNGTWVEGVDRNGQIPRGRNTAFRVYVDVVEAGWVTRDLEARMTVIQADGTMTEYTITSEIGTDSSQTSLQSNFLIGVLAEDMLPGVKFQIELYEKGEAADYSSLPEAEFAPKALPEADFIGVEGLPQKMRLMMVPVQYDFGGCSTLPDLTGADLQPYDDSLFQHNPVEELDIQIHAPYVVNDLDLSDGNDFFSLLNRAVQLRASENPDPNVYYYMLFDNCGACIGSGGGGGGCVLGVAPGIPGPTIGEAGQRVAIGTRYLSGQEVGIETFVHEVGHSQGRQHVSCPGGGAAGPDITYPYEGGQIGVWGFGVRDFGVRNATTHTDYMGYCNPTWVSDWQWKATYSRIQTLSSWDSVDMSNAAQDHVLVGHFNPETGESVWWTEQGSVAAQDNNPQFGLRFVESDSTVQEASAVSVHAWSEGPWVTIRTNLPEAEAFERSTAVEFVTPSLTARVEKSAITLHHVDSLATP